MVLHVDHDMAAGYGESQRNAVDGNPSCPSVSESTLHLWLCKIFKLSGFLAKLRKHCSSLRFDQAVVHHLGIKKSGSSMIQSVLGFINLFMFVSFLNPVVEDVED